MSSPYLRRFGALSVKRFLSFSFFSFKNSHICILVCMMVSHTFLRLSSLFFQTSFLLFPD
jgi:hypothetical protein